MALFVISDEFIVALRFQSDSIAAFEIIFIGLFCDLQDTKLNLTKASLTLA